MNEEQDIVQNDLVIDEVVETKKYVSIAILGEMKSGKSEFITQITNDPQVKAESEIDAQLDDILSQLHAADDRIAKDREETLRLGKETRAMLTDLRKQLG